METESEVYRFIWSSSFDGDATVRIAREGDKITLRWRYDAFRIPLATDSPAVVTLWPAAWSRLQRDLLAANFWALDPIEKHSGLDGARWLIEGRRRDRYHAVQRWSPDGAFHDLGRLFFALAGSPLSGVTLY